MRGRDGAIDHEANTEDLDEDFDEDVTTDILPRCNPWTSLKNDSVEQCRQLREHTLPSIPAIGNGGRS